MTNIKFTSGENIPLEMHKAKIIKALNLRTLEERRKLIEEAGNNTFLLKSRDVFLDMLTDSGVNAMSDKQQSAMLLADDAYAGSESFFKLENTLKNTFGMNFFLPTHQGRAAENILSKHFIKPGQVVPMNYHFTTRKAHITLNGGKVEEFIIDEGLKTESNFPFKGNINTEKLDKFIEKTGVQNIAFVCMEAGTNLIGGQPFSLKNLQETGNICRKHGLLLIMDASLLTDNLYFIKTREKECEKMSIAEITMKMANECDVIYFSGRKFGSGRGGGILLNDEKHAKSLRELVTIYEGFITYGGMSIMEIEAINEGVKEAMDFNMINQGPEFIKFLSDEFLKLGVPVVTPSGGLGLHLDAKRFIKHVPQNEYQAASLTSAIYVISGVRGMERGTMAESRNPDGSEHFANMELVRLAVPRRVFTMSQLKYVADRVGWLYKNRELIGGLKFSDEPKTLRFFLGKLTTTSNWMDKLVAKFREDFGDSL
jgi:tryptophanase